MAAARGVEGALAHQAMHAGFGAQQAVGVFALDLDRGRADAGHVAFGFFQHFGLEALAFAILEVLAQQDAGPVAGLGAAGAGLDVDKAVVGVGRLVEHAAELKARHCAFNAFQIGGDRFQRVVVAFVLGHVEKVLCIGERGRHAFQASATTFSRDFFSLPRAWARSASSQILGSAIS